MDSNNNLFQYSVPGKFWRINVYGLMFLFALALTGANGLYSLVGSFRLALYYILYFPLLYLPYQGSCDVKCVHLELCTV